MNSIMSSPCQMSNKQWTSTKIKWQNRWTISESGRQLYDLIPIVGNASHLDMPDSQIGRVLTEMRTGYSRLNKYRNNRSVPHATIRLEKKKPLNTTHCTATFTIMREPTRSVIKDHR